MSKNNLIVIVVWTFTILAVMFFFFSLRSEEDAMKYSLIALGLWGVAFLLNKLKTGKKEER